MLSPLLMLGVALAAPGGSCGSTEQSIEAVRRRGLEVAYRCLADDDEAAAPLIAWLSGEGAEPSADRAGEERVQRALAVHMMQRLDAPVELPSLRAVGAADRRLLRDAVHARRGRRSPARAHEQVFARFDWYEPDDGFSNARLTPLDRENLSLIDAPPKPTPPPAAEGVAEPASAAVVNEAPPAAAQVESWCGCGSGPGSVGAGALMAALMPLVVRRRQTTSG